MRYRGGRGKKAPYETIMYRIPLPVKPAVEALSETYRASLEEDPSGDQLLSRVQDAISAQNNEEIDQLKKALKQHSQAIALLQEALTLNSDAGGAIKQQIRQALELL